MTLVAHDRLVPARWREEQLPWITVAAGRYLLEEELGRGGMGRVHRGWDPLLGRAVAIKLASPRHSETAASPRRALDTRAREARLLREARVLARLSHGNVVRLLDAGREGERAFLVMDLAPGQSLAAWLREPRELCQVLHVAARLARALEHVHAAGVVHRDLKPENVLVDERGEPVLIDFGLALGTGLAREAEPGPAGTLPWMAPEQARGELERVGPWSDVYGLGAVLYRSLGGCPPHEADSPWSLLLEVASGPSPSLAARCPFLDPALSGLVDRCLANDPQARPGAGEVAEELERLLRPSRRRWSSRLLRRLLG